MTDQAVTAREPLVFEVRTTGGHVAGVEIRVHPLAVEVWRGLTRQAVFNREQLAVWLRDPQSPIRANDVTFSVDETTVSRLAITMPEVPCWALSQQMAHALYARVGQPGPSDHR